MEDCEIVESFTEAQFAEFLKLPQIEGWGDYDFEVYDLARKLDFVQPLLAINKQGEVLGGIECVKLPEYNMVYLASFFVGKEHRNKGIGIKLWNEAWKNQQLGKLMAIDGNDVNDKRYREQKGFSFAAKTHAIRFVGKAGKLREAITKLDVAQDVSVQQLCKGSLSSSMLAYDRGISNRNRADFFNKYSEISHWRGVEAKDPATNETRGYGMLIPANHGWLKLSPIYADSWSAAMAIVSALIEGLPDEQELVFHLPNIKADFQSFLTDRADFREILRMYRSYTQAFDFNLDRNKIYSYTKHACMPDC